MTLRIVNGIHGHVAVPRAFADRTDGLRCVYFGYRDADGRQRVAYVGPDDERGSALVQRFKKVKSPRQLAPVAQSAQDLGRARAMAACQRTGRTIQGCLGGGPGAWSGLEEALHGRPAASAEETSGNIGEEFVKRLAHTPYQATQRGFQRLPRNRPRRSCACIPRSRERRPHHLALARSCRAATHGLRVIEQPSGENKQA